MLNIKVKTMTPEEEKELKFVVKTAIKIGLLMIVLFTTLIGGYLYFVKNG